MEKNTWPDEVDTSDLAGVQRTEFFADNVLNKIYEPLADIFDDVACDAEIRLRKKIASLLKKELPREEWTEDEIYEWLSDNA